MPFRSTHLPTKKHPMPPIVVVWFQHKLSLFVQNQCLQVKLRTMKNCSRRHRAMGPRNVFLNHLELGEVEQMLVSRIRKNRKGRLFVCELCAKGVCHAHTTLPVCLDQRVVQPTLVKKFVNDDSLVYDVNAKSMHG